MTGRLADSLMIVDHMLVQEQLLCSLISRYSTVAEVSGPWLEAQDM